MDDRKKLDELYCGNCNDLVNWHYTSKKSIHVVCKSCSKKIKELERKLDAAEKEVDEYESIVDSMHMTNTILSQEVNDG